MRKYRKHITLVFLYLVYLVALLVLIAFGISVKLGNAQELSPRANRPAPKGTKVAFVGYQYSFGDVLTDPSLSITGLDSQIHVGFLGYLQTFSLFNRTTNLIIELPYTSATTTGIILAPAEETLARRDMAGI
jgi:membrane protease YdiL (CAAX protease family)